MDDIDDVFSYLLAKEKDEKNKDVEPKSVYILKIDISG